MGTGAQPEPALQKRYWTMKVLDLRVAPIDVDTIAAPDCVSIQAGDVILWYSSSHRLFKIIGMKRILGNGPEQPFDGTDFSDKQDWKDEKSSGKAGPVGEQTRYKYKVVFKAGQVIDPIVIVDQ